MATQVTHDPFARAELMRETVPITGNMGCDWCGGYSKAGKLTRLFRYAWKPDSIGLERSRAANPIGKLFCSVGCYRTYKN